MITKVDRREAIAALSGTLVAALPMAQAYAQSVETSMKDPIETRNKTIVSAAFDAWKAGTGSPFDLLTEDATWVVVGRSLASNTYNGRETFLREVIRPFNARMSVALSPVIRGLYAEGNSIVIFFDASGTARDGKPYSNTYAWFWDMRDGKVIRAHAFFDSIEFNDLWSRVKPGPL
jgi:ketosteroid isomerase-like protein